MTTSIKLKILPDIYAIARLEPNAALPDWADGPGFVSISRTDDELSIVCKEARIPDGLRKDGGWSCFKLLGPFEFGETGIVLSVIRPLSENGIGIFLVSTFDGDHLLVKATDLEKACLLLAGAGHVVIGS
ncbi:ACT domain-containing protein [Agrobacterium sp. rho-8.1]|nr:ACT domain-containing protein [Agrobacterium sp. rho-8.1]